MPCKSSRRFYGKIIGVGRFRILGGGKVWNIGGGQGGANSQHAHDVASTSFRRHVPTRFLINQCQIITFLIVKSDIIENSRIELRGIVLPEPSNQIKVTFIIILPFNLAHLRFLPVSHRKGGWIIGRGQRVCWPPSQIIGGLVPLPPPSPLFLRL